MTNKYSDWMYNSRELIGSKGLNTIQIPGTHDSGSYGITENSKYSSDFPDELVLIQNQLKPSIMAGWSKTQINSIYLQLLDGIRYFDFRIDLNPNDEKLYLVHAMFSVTLKTALDDIKKFIISDGHDKEIIIIDIQNMNKANPNAVYEEIVSSLTKDKFASSTEFKPNSMVNEFWDNKKQIILIGVKPDEGNQNFDIVWQRNDVHDDTPGCLCSPYSKDDFHTTNESFEYIKKKFDKIKPIDNNKFFVFQGVCTPDIKTYALSIINPESKEIEYKKNVELPRQIEKLEKQKDEYENELAKLDYWNPLDYDNYAKYSTLLASTTATLEYKKGELEYLRYTTFPPDLSIYSLNVSRAVDSALFTNEWKRSNINIVMIDFYNQIDIVDDILETYVGTPQCITETSDDIPGFIEGFNYDHQPGLLFRTIDSWRFNRGFAGSYPNFNLVENKFQKQVDFTLFGAKTASWQDVNYNDIGLKKNIVYYEGNNKDYKPGVALRKTHMWAVNNGYTAGFPTYQARKGFMGVIGLHKCDLVMFRDIPWKDILDNQINYYDSKAGEAIRKTHEWAIKENQTYLTAFPTFNYYYEVMGVVIIKKRPPLPSEA